MFWKVFLNKLKKKFSTNFEKIILSLVIFLCICGILIIIFSTCKIIGAILLGIAWAICFWMV